MNYMNWCALLAELTELKLELAQLQTELVGQPQNLIPVNDYHTTCCIIL
jgi:hypothetical protein